MRKMDATTADSLAASASRYHRARGRVRGVIVDGGRQEERAERWIRSQPALSGA